jgi:two-component sensor histidine kinase
MSDRASHQPGAHDDAERPASPAAGEDLARLLAWLSHRIRNDFGTLIALIELEAVHATPPAADGFLLSVTDRLRAVAAAYAHMRLGPEGSHPIVDGGGLLEALCEELGTAAELEPPLEVEVEAHPLSLPQAVSLTLVVNEILAPTLRRAAAGGSAGPVAVRLAAADAELVLTMAGDGLDAPAGPRSEVLRRLVQRLRGRLSVEATEPGPCFRIAFPSS